MHIPSVPRLARLSTVAMLLACRSESAPTAIRVEAMSFANSAWSEPVNLGPVVNSTAGDNNPTLSPDELSLYFASDRPGGLGGTDIWVARRASPGAPWDSPVHLGAPVSSPSADGAPVLSADGHLLFIHSNRPGGSGANDIWVARRADPNDDAAWEAPVNLGADVNTPDEEQAPAYVQSENGGTLYFNRGNQIVSQSDLYRAVVKHNGETGGPATAVIELNDPTANDAGSTVRADGREILFFSARAGGFGGTDIWMSTRQTVNDPWSAPVNWEGPPFNTGAAEQQPDLSHDGRTLLFSSTRPGGSGTTDIWMSTRTPSGR